MRSIDQIPCDTARTASVRAAFGLAGVLCITAKASGQATLRDIVPPPQPATLLERIVNDTAISTALGIIPGWAGVFVLALVPAALTIAMWMWWHTRIASDPAPLAGRRMAWMLRLTAHERRIIDRLAQCARTGPAAVLLVPDACDRAIALLPETTREERRVHAAATALRAKLFAH